MQPLCGRPRSPHPAPSLRAGPRWRERLALFLKEKGLRATKPREQVAEIALKLETHFDIQSLIRHVQEKHPDIGPATVYRSVRTLCEAGLLSETFQNDGGVTLYEPQEEEHHDHIVCLDCNEIFEFHDENLEKAQDKAIRSLGFTEAKHKHVIYAKCGFFAQKKLKK
jgi:Fur family ferric uptake transcriptional regulator